MLSLAIFVSGTGTNMQNIINRTKKGELEAEVKVVISDREGIPALKKAQKEEISAYVIEPEMYSKREDFEASIIEILNKKGIDLIVLAGYLQRLSPYFVKHFENQIMNIHPSLLPAFKGLNAQKQAFEYGVKVSGCTVHFVDEGLDTGPIILQQALRIREYDSLETFTQRLKEVEHELYPEAIRLFAENKLIIKKGRVKILE